MPASIPWVICLHGSDWSTITPLRLIPAMEVAEDGLYLWLRVPRGDETLEHRLALLPALHRYEQLQDGCLRPIGKLLPDGKLPALKWQAISEWCQVTPPLSAIPAKAPVQARLALVRSTEEQEPDLLLATMADWAEFGQTGAQIRLGPLRFAASAAGQVAICGRPLPPLPGGRYVLHQGVAIPCGFTWRPAIDAAVLARVMGVLGGQVAIWHEDGRVERLHPEQFVPATRSAIRETAQKWADAVS